ncbi:MAG: pirin family protein [Deltaproteobacteria bacterium]|nr:pirin family protein [Deltaproteobacteria bacterium]
MRISRRDLVVGSAILSCDLACKTDVPRADGPSAPAAAVPPERRRDREVDRVFVAQATSDGAGVKLRRALGGAALPMLDPFLLLDEFRSDDPNDYLAGFPEHPHRGFETVTYMIDGAMEHADSVGNKGRLGPGSAQWMTAGRGIVHSEMPKQDRGVMWGYQLWVNLPRARKMIRPRYQDIPPKEIREVTRDDTRIRVVAGDAFDTRGPVSGIDVEPLFVDVALLRGSSLAMPIPTGHNAFVFVAEGAARIGPARREVRRGQLAVLSRSGEQVALACDSDAGGRVLVFAGRPLEEPVARRGPFVMNTDEEIRQAFDDYRSGRLVGGG